MPGHQRQRWLRWDLDARRNCRPIVDRTYPFNEAAQGLAHVEGGRTKGKVVITMV
jgi:NADPH:quinone reductase-like Zn-dependent oxidoreductase